MGFTWMAGRTARTITNRPISRCTWNVFCAVMFTVIFTVFGYIFYQMLGEVIVTRSEHVYLSYNDNVVITETKSYVLGNHISVNMMEECLNTGDTILVIESRLTGELIEVVSNGDQIYQINKTSTGIVITATFFFIWMTGAIGLIFYIVNAKHPSGWVRKMQRKIVL